MKDVTTTEETMNRTAQNRPPTDHADTITAMQRDQGRYARKARSLEAAGRTDEAREAREIADFIGREIVADADPAVLREELATCERRAVEVEDSEAAGRWRRRAGEIEDAVQQCEAAKARHRAKSADFSFVQPIMDGHEGESVLDN